MNDTPKTGIKGNLCPNPAGSKPDTSADEDLLAALIITITPIPTEEQHWRKHRVKMREMP